jgi:hypothetical protein
MTEEVIQSRSVRVAITKGNETFEMLQIPGMRIDPPEEEEDAQYVEKLHGRWLIDIQDRPMPECIFLI